MSAARQVRNDDSKAMFKSGNLKGPIRAAAAKSMNEQERFAASAFQVVNHQPIIAKERHRNRSSPSMAVVAACLVSASNRAESAFRHLVPLSVIPHSRLPADP